MGPKLSFKRHIRYERKQLRVNRKAHYASYAGSCYHSQQLAEKLVKQKLQDFGAENTYTHNLPSLVGDMASIAGINLGRKEYKELREACLFLSRMYDESRYPQESEDEEGQDITVEQAAQAMRYARLIESWVNTLHFPQDPEEQEIVRQRVAELGYRQKVRDAKRFNRFMLKVEAGIDYISDSSES